MASDVGPAPPTTARGTERARYDEADPGAGWVLFAGTMIALVGMLNVIYGIAGISNSKFYVNDAQFILSDLNTWGWALLVLGVVQLGVAFGIWAQISGVRWIGVLIAGLNAVVQMLLLPAYPFLALTLFTLDILVIYGLVAHGRRMDA